jgi:DNA-directed RNA polymerase I, II, and III subunit RPABC2
MASPADMPVIKLNPPRDFDDDEVDDELPPPEIEDVTDQISNPVASWSITEMDDDDEEEAQQPSEFVAGEQEVEDSEEEDGEDEQSDWEGDVDAEDEDEQRSVDDDDDESRSGVVTMPDDDEYESAPEQEGGDDEGDAGSDTEEMVRLIDPDTAKKELADYHPTIIVPTGAELDALAMVVRDAEGNIIDENHSRTIPWMTRFEQARVIGTRAVQLSNGAPPQIELPDGLIDSMKIAELELQNNQIPFIIRRPLPDGTSEYWPVNELQLL